MLTTYAPIVPLPTRRSTGVHRLGDSCFFFDLRIMLSNEQMTPPCAHDFSLFASLCTNCSRKTDSVPTAWQEVGVAQTTFFDENERVVLPFFAKCVDTLLLGGRLAW